MRSGEPQDDSPASVACRSPAHARVGVQGRPLWEVAGAMESCPMRCSKRLWAIAREVPTDREAFAVRRLRQMTGTVAAASA